MCAEGWTYGFVPGQKVLPSVISMCGPEYYAIVNSFQKRKKIYLALSVFLKIKMYEIDYMAGKAFVTYCHL